MQGQVQAVVEGPGLDSGASSWPESTTMETADVHSEDLVPEVMPVRFPQVLSVASGKIQES